MPLTTIVMALLTTTLDAFLYMDADGDGLEFF